MLKQPGVDALVADAVYASALLQEVENLRAALTSSRVIGAAVGLVMAEHRVDRETAFEMLRAQSQNSNVRLARIAADKVDDAERMSTAEPAATAAHLAAPVPLSENPRR